MSLRELQAEHAEWMRCYNDGWQGEIVPESFSHPAKFSRALIRRIYEHAFAEGWLAPGMTAVDPFAGVALGALDAMWHGLTWIGVELESRFCALGQQNLALWQRKYGSKAGWGTARIIQGDSRQLASVIQSAEVVIGSPPFQASMVESGDPNYAHKFHGSQKDYGSSPGQLGAMKEGPPPMVDCVVGSPPFSQAQSGGGINRDKIVRQKDGRVHALGNDGYNANMQGDSVGQLGSLPEGRFDAVVSSPPYAETMSAPHDGIKWRQAKSEPGTENHQKRGRSVCGEYGRTEGQLGKESLETFWSAASEVVAQCYQILRPRGHAIFVCKDFIRKGQRVPFSDQWQALCESVGLRLVCRHRAILVANHGSQETMWNGTEELRTERKSFFRRLAERKGSPAIDWEDVLCFLK